MLLNHWTLYDSIINSNYSMINMRLFEEKGKQKLNEMLVRIGVRQQQAKQLYKCMHDEVKETMKSKIVEECVTYNIPDIVCMSFAKQVSMNK